MQPFITEWPQYFTATNLEWKKLLQPDKYKDIIIDSLRFLVNDQRIKLYAFVIMINHVHLIWQMLPFIDPKDVQRDFLKYTAGKIKADLAIYHQSVLEHFLVNAKDRKYQFWERNSLSVELRTPKTFIQKMEYIHSNPVRAGLCAVPENYKYSSAQFYEIGIDDWGFLTNYKEYSSGIGICSVVGVSRRAIVPFLYQVLGNTNNKTITGGFLLQFNCWCSLAT